MIIYNQNSVKQKLESSFLLRAHGLGGASAIFFYYFPLFQSAEGGQRGRRRAGSGPIRAQNSAQNRFEHRSVSATRCDIRQLEESLFARSASLTLGSARKFPYISGLNQRGGQNQKLPFCSGEGGSWWRSHQSKSHLIENLLNAFALQFFPPLAEGKRTKQVFKNPVLYTAPKSQRPKATLLKN